MSVKPFFVVTLITLALGCGVSNLYASLSISPAYVELSLDKGRPSGQFLITNAGEEEERYRIKTIHFFFLADGGFREIPPDEHSLADWVRFNPKEFVLPPNSRQTIRFMVVTTGKLANGEYWGAMELESLKTTVGKGKDAKGRELSIEVIPTILVPIFGKVGAVRYQAILKETRILAAEKGQKLESVMANTGQGRLFLAGQYEIVDGQGKSLLKGSLGRAYVLPGADRNFTVPLATPLPAGQYTVKVEYSSTSLATPLTQETALTWNP